VIKIKGGTVAISLARGAKEFGANPLVFYGDEKVSFEQMNFLANRVANTL